MKKQVIRKLLAILLCVACFPAGMPVHAQEKKTDDPYIVLKINNNKVVVLLRIGKKSLHARVSGDEYKLLGDTIVAHSDICPNVEYGDIVVYQGNDLMMQCGTSYNAVGKDLDMAPEDADAIFEKIGTVFDNPTADIESRTIDGKPFLAVRMANGATYLIGQGSDDDIYVDITLCPNQQGDVNDSNDVDIMDVITMNKYILGLRELSESAVPAADLNHDGNLDAADSLAILKLVLDMTD